MRTWIKSGLIALVVFLFSYVLLYVSSLSTKSEGIAILTSVIFFFGEHLDFPLMFFGFAILYFAIGAVIGFTAEKLRPKK